MDELADGLQIWQSATGTFTAIAVFVLSATTGRQLAEDVVMAFAAGAILGSSAILVVALLGLS